MKLLVACLVITGCAEAAPPNAIIGGLIDGGRDNGGTFDPDASTIDAPANVATLTQTATNMVVDGNSVGCHLSGSNVSQDNAYFRVFSLSDASIRDAFHVTQVDFGIELAESDGGTGQPATLKIGSYAGAVDTSTTTLDLSVVTVTPITSANITIRDTPAPGAMSAPITAVIPSGGSFLVELDVPGGQTFFIGSNTGTETKPGFTKATGCGLADPTALSSLGLGTISMVMSVTGTH